MDSHMKICFLFGHADAPESILDALIQAIEAQYIHFGVRRFIVGHRGNFDRLATVALKSVNDKFPDMYLQMLSAYHPTLQNDALPECFDSSYYPDGLELVPMQYRISSANRKVLSFADAVICYATRYGNAGKLLHAAIRKNIPLINLASRKA